MKTFLILSLLFIPPSEPLLIDFGNERGGEDWIIVNDGVMGGRSISTAVINDDSVLFSGFVSLQNNGGFASIRGPYGQYDLSNYTTVILKVKGTSRNFALSLDKSRAWFRPNYKYEFTPNEDEWSEITISLADFKESSVGRYTGSTMDKDDLEQVIRMGIILYDKQEGDFQLEIDFIKFN